MVNLTTADSAASAYDRRQLVDKAEFLGFTLEIIKRTEAAFVVLPRRWVVERTLGWLTRHRRLVRDYQARMEVSEAMIDFAMAGLLIRRITRIFRAESLETRRHRSRAPDPSRGSRLQ